MPEKNEIEIKEDIISRFNEAVSNGEDELDEFNFENMRRSEHEYLIFLHLKSKLL